MISSRKSVLRKSLTAKSRSLSKTLHIFGKVLDKPLRFEIKLKTVITQIVIKPVIKPKVVINVFTSMKNHFVNLRSEIHLLIRTDKIKMSSSMSKWNTYETTSVNAKKNHC